MGVSLAAYRETREKKMSQVQQNVSSLPSFLRSGQRPFKLFLLPTFPSCAYVHALRKFIRNVYRTYYVRTCSSLAGLFLSLYALSIASVATRAWKMQFRRSAVEEELSRSLSPFSLLFFNPSCQLAEVLLSVRLSVCLVHHHFRQ